MASEGDCDAEEIDTVTVRLGDLTVSATRIRRRPQAGAQSPASSSGLPSAVSEPVRLGPEPAEAPLEGNRRADGPPQSAPARGRAREGKVHFYVVYRCDRDPGLEGIHHCRWPALQARLPGQNLFGSGAHDCKKLVDEEKALEYWRRFRDGPATIFHY